MSRHSIDLPDGGELTVGWDPPLDTFFGMVADEPDCDDDEVRLWVGTSRSELPTVEHLFHALGAYTQYVKQLADDLERERADDDLGSY